MLYEPRVVGLTGLQSDRLQTQYRPIASVHSTQHSTSGKSRSRDERIRVFRYTQCWGTVSPNAAMSLATKNTSHNPLLKSARCQRVQITQVLKVSRESTRMAQRHINTMTGECPGKYPGKLCVQFKHIKYEFECCTLTSVISVRSSSHYRFYACQDCNQYNVQRSCRYCLAAYHKTAGRLIFFGVWVFEYKIDIFSNSST